MLQKVFIGFILEEEERGGRRGRGRGKTGEGEGERREGKGREADDVCRSESLPDSSFEV